MADRRTATPNADGKTTGEVALLLGLSEPQLQAVLRRDRGLRPEMVRGRRRWSREDIARLRAALARCK